MMTLEFSVGVGIVTLILGAIFGFLYFGGLWLTIHKITNSQYAIGYGILSFLGRMILLAVGLYFVIQIGWIYLFSWLIGFFIARTLLIQQLRPTAKT